MQVQFPFGFGLSYTTFELANLRLSATTLTDSDELSVSVDVTNSGTVAGKAVVQVYVHDRASALVRPPKELKGFAKVALEPGETQTVIITLDPRAFAYYAPTYHTWVVESGDFEILVGQSSADLPLCATVAMQSAQPLAPGLHRFSTLREWQADPCGAAILQPLLDDVIEKVTVDAGEVPITEVIGWAPDLPLDVVFGFWGHDRISTTPEEVVADLLSRLTGA